MKNEEQKTGLWAAAQKHLEKEQRLKALKDEQGYKKPLRVNSQGPWLKIASFALAIVVILGLSVWSLFTFGIAQRHITLAKVGTEKVSILDYNYTYNAVYNMYNNYVAQGYLPATIQGTLDMDALSPFEEDGKKYTYGEYISRVTNEELQNIKLLVGLAKKAGFALSEEKEAEIEANLQAAETQLGGTLAFENALVNLLGPGASRAEYKRLLVENALVAEYQSHLTNSYTFTDAEIQAEYEANRDNYDLVNYREFVFYPENMTAEESALPTEQQVKIVEEKRQSLEEQVSNFVALVKDEESFKAQVVSFSPEESKEKNAVDAVTLRRGLSKKALPSDVAEWLFASERKLNDVQVFDASIGKRVVLFVGRGRSEERLAQVGLLMLPINVAVTEENKEAVQQALAALEQKAVSVASEITNEESLNAVLAQLKEEGQTAYGLWQESASKANLPAEAAEWAFAEGRKAGEHYVITTQGEQANVSLYVFGGQQDRIAWQVTVNEELKSSKYEKTMEELKALPENQVKINPFWLRFTSRLAVGTLTGDEVFVRQTASSETVEASSSENK